MSTRKSLTFLIGLMPLTAALGASPDSSPHLGQPISEKDIAEWNITVFPSGAGLPPGSGTSAAGAVAFASQCAACHGSKGEGGLGPALITDKKRSGIDEATTSIANFWPYATTIYDYIRRAMPWQAPRSTSDQAAWDLTAFILEQNHLIPPGTVIDQGSLPKVKMPNRNGFIPAFPELVPPSHPMPNVLSH